MACEFLYLQFDVFIAAVAEDFRLVAVMILLCFLHCVPFACDQIVAGYCENASQTSRTLMQLHLKDLGAGEISNGIRSHRYRLHGVRKVVNLLDASTIGLLAELFL